MTIEEAIAFERQQAKDKRNEHYTFGIQKSKEVAEEHEQLAEWLEELKTIKEMDLSIPQHFTKEQSGWIKAYCIKRNIEFYNKAIDDFAEELKDYFVIPHDVRVIEMKAEQLKAGERDENS